MSAAKAAVSFRPEHKGWRASWWLQLGELSAFPIGAHEGLDHDAVLAYAVGKYVGEPPPDDHSKIWGAYTCMGCEAAGVRLWRDYNTFLDGQTLRCRKCTEAHEGKTMRRGSDQCGWSVPAVPTPDGQTFWGYTSVPSAACAWWEALPEEGPVVVKLHRQICGHCSKAIVTGQTYVLVRCPDGTEESVHSACMGTS